MSRLDESSLGRSSPASATSTIAPRCRSGRPWARPTVAGTRRPAEGRAHRVMAERQHLRRPAARQAVDFHDSVPAQWGHERTRAHRRRRHRAGRDARIVLRNEGYEPSVVIRGDEVLPVFGSSSPIWCCSTSCCRARTASMSARRSGPSPACRSSCSPPRATRSTSWWAWVGADDYVVKPFKPKELVARVRARLRRTDDPKPETLAVGDLAIDVAGHSVKRDGTPSPDPAGVRPARLPGAASVAGVHQEELLEKVWGYRHAADTAGQRPRPASALEGRARPGASRGRRDRSRCRLQGRSGLT